MAETQNDSIATLTTNAVKALLSVIASDPTGYPGHVKEGAAVRGTNSTFASEALKNMLDCPALNAVVLSVIREESPDILERKPR